MTPLPLSEKRVQQWARKHSPEHLSTELENVAKTLGESEFRELTAKELVKWLHPEEILPSEYTSYKRLIHDGIEFFLANVSTKRLISLIVKQVYLPNDSTESRLYELALFFPSLHKLAQIIARNRLLDPKIKEWLIKLESCHYGQSAEATIREIRQFIPDELALRFAENILAEASVGEVIRFEVDAENLCDTISGVFKTLKPDIKACLQEELDILRAMAGFFDANNTRYPFRNLQFTEFFEDISNHLVKETDLATEQYYLKQAAKFWSGMKGVHIPKLLPYSNANMTALEFIDGCKVTDAPLSTSDKKSCAKLLFEALICRPIFAPEEPAIYHGDPHAGNILATVNEDSGNFTIHLIDWSLAGQLSKNERAQIVRLIYGILSDNHYLIYTTANKLNTSKAEGSRPPRDYLEKFIANLLTSNKYKMLSIARKTFMLMEELSYEGLVFSPDLVMFRKAFFTLEGLLHELDPRFDMDSFMAEHITELITSETPDRYYNQLLPGLDVPENYRSLMSNTDLACLIQGQHIANINNYGKLTAELMAKQTELMTIFTTRWLQAFTDSKTAKQNI